MLKDSDNFDLSFSRGLDHFYEYPTFTNVIDNNIPCIFLCTVDNVKFPNINTIIQFLSGQQDDIFLVHPNDLKIWDPNDV